METRSLSLDCGRVCQLEDGSYEFALFWGHGIFSLSATDMAKLAQWVHSPDPASPELPLQQRVSFHSTAEVYTQVSGCEGWEYREYKQNKPFSRVCLYYRGAFVTVLKHWSKHFAEEKDAKVHYATMAQAAQAHMQDRWVQMTEEKHRAKQETDPESLATAGQPLAEETVSSSDQKASLVP